MAYIDGETLTARLRREGRLPADEAIELVTTIARAMAEAHARGIVHRDLKPANLMLDRRGRPVVMDFGLALRTSRADDLRLTLTGVAMGTPAYMPPEQAGGDVDAIGPASDVYALGVMLYELLTGRVPFRGRTFGQLLAQIERDPPPVPSSQVEGIPPALDAVILTALAKAPADRFPSAAELADALDQYQAGGREELVSRYGAVLERTPTGSDTRAFAPPPPRKRWGWAVAALFAFALLLVTAGVIYVRTDKGDLKVELTDPTAKVEVRVNGEEVILDPDGKPLRVRAGENQKVVVSGADFETVSESFDLKRGGASVVRVTLVPKGGVIDLKKIGSPIGPSKPPPVLPKPVTFPKDKTLVEAGGWQILTDATKEQTQAWLDERKAAKHSVVWLDAIEVDRKPLFCAVAALDGRAPKWLAFLDTPAEDFASGEAQKKVGANDHPLSVSGYGDAAGVKPVLATLWRQERWPFFFLPDGGPDGVKEAEDKLKKGNGVFRLIRPYTVGKGTVFGGVGYVALGEKAGYLLDATEEQLGEFVQARRAAGERVTSLAMFVKDGQPRYTVVGGSFPNKAEWRTDHGLTSAQLTETVAALAKEGYHPANVTACPHDGAVRYCTVWVKEPLKPVPYPKDKVVVKADGWETIADATKEQVEAWLAEKKKDRHSVTWLDACPVAGKPLYSAVAALDGRVATWEAWLAEKTADANNLAVVRKRIDTQAYFAAAVAGFPDGETIRTAILWHPGTRNWGILAGDPKANLEVGFTQIRGQGYAVRTLRPLPVGKSVYWSTYMEAAPTEETSHLLDGDTDGLTRFLEAARKSGLRPVSVAACEYDGKLVWGAATRGNKAGAEWATDTDLSVVKLTEAMREKAKLGFRPECVTAYAWDGAVRYCVVWIKEPPKPVPYPKGPTVIKEGGWAVLADATKEQTQTWLDERKKDKHSVVWLDACEVGGKPVFAAVAALDGRVGTWEAFLDVPATGFSNELVKRKLDRLDRHPVSISGYTLDGVVRIAGLSHLREPAVWFLNPDTLRLAVPELDERAKKNGQGYSCFRPYPALRGATFFAAAVKPMADGGEKRFDLTRDDLDQFAADTRTAGHRLTSVSAYPVGSVVKFAAVSGTNPDKADWSFDTGLTATELIGRVGDKSKLGLHPSAVTAYTGDGAVRYCVTWAKEAEKKPEPKK
jgi:Protein kinase domain/Bacterial tandem repeat domain 1